MPKFRRKPVIIEAVRWRGHQHLGITSEPADQPVEITAENMHNIRWEPLPEWLPKPLRTVDEAGTTAATPGSVTRDGECLLIATLEGVMRAEPGDWIIQGVKGELYPCKPDIFAMTYEAIPESAEIDGEKENE